MLFVEDLGTSLPITRHYRTPITPLKSAPPPRQILQAPSHSLGIQASPNPFLQALPPSVAVPGSLGAHAGGNKGTHGRHIEGRDIHEHLVMLGGGQSINPHRLICRKTNPRLDRM
jgi:hypothetical protein